MRKNNKLDPVKVRCDGCGNMTSDPYVYHIVPSPYLYDWKSIPPYIKNAPKTKRVDLTGKSKITIHNYCNNECYENKKLLEY